MGQLNLLFIRHGETQDNIDRMLQGQRDTDLTLKGHEQAKVIQAKLESVRIDALYHSPLNRIVDTIKPTLPYHPQAEVHADADLMGQALGSLEGGSYDQVDMNNPRSADGRPGVESFYDYVQRLRRVMARIIGAEGGKVADGERTVVVATHGVGITSIFKMLEASPSCHTFGPQIAVRGAEAYEVRWTDSDDIAKLVVPHAERLRLKDGILEWQAISGKPFVIETWGKKAKAV